MNTKVLKGYEARKKILNGINIVYDAVRATMGPSGKNVLLPRTMNRGPRVTNDGYTVSENVLLKDPHERLAADFFKEASKKTNELAGDGTTGTAVIAGHLVNKIFKEIPNENIPSAGTSKAGDVMQLRREMKEWKDKVIEEIKKQSKPIKTLDDLKKIAKVSIEDGKISDIVANMVWNLGVDNYIDVTEGYKGEIETEEIRGMRFPAKTAARAFVNNLVRFEMVAEDAYVFITNYKLDNPYDVVDILNSCKVSKIALIAPEFSENVLISLLQTTKNGLFCYPIKSPSLRSEQLEDLATYTGATFIDKNEGRKLNSITIEDLGFADKIVVKDTENKEDAILIGGKGFKSKAVEWRCKVLKAQMDEAKNNISKEQLKRRIANMSSAVGVIRVGASTDAESLYLKLKIEDGVYACKAALQEGYVKGGGLCLKEISETLPKNILTESLLAPYEQIQKNANGIAIGKEVIDPAKVIRLQIEHGISIASTIITTDVIIAEIPDGKDGEKDIAKAIGKLVYFHAKERGMIKESEEEAEMDRAKMFSEALFNDVD